MEPKAVFAEGLAERSKSLVHQELSRQEQIIYKTLEWDLACEQDLDWW